MLCYKDKTYCCHEDCTRKFCTDKITKEVREGAARTGLPLSVADFNNGKCYTTEEE